MKRIFSFLGIIFIFISIPCLAEQPVRIATFNIKWLSSQDFQFINMHVTDVETQGVRLAQLRTAIQLLDADIIGLQEINDRQALEKVFGTTDWTIVIDDDSSEHQKLALAVRRPFTVVGTSNLKLNAGPEHYLFEDQPNHLFPDDRDVLCIEVKLPNNLASVFVMVHHAKARMGGRHATDPRRVGASRVILQELDANFDDKLYVLLGDFNDSPDDASLNILESGNPYAVTEMESLPGPFLFNLTEPLYALGHVSHGRTSLDVVNDRINTIDPDSRQRNYDNRYENMDTGDILFDQILIPQQMYAYYVLGSAAVFNDPVGVRPNKQQRPSDHLPVYADFLFPTGQTPETVELKIIALLPNPDASQNNRETVTLKNLTGGQIDLSGWLIRDRANNEVNLAGTIGPNAEKELDLLTRPILNNGGDTVMLIKSPDQEIHRVEYPSSRKGQYIRFN